MKEEQLRALGRLLGLPTLTILTAAHLRLQLRHHINGLRKEDRDYIWEGVDSLSTEELIDACKKRAIPFHEVSEQEMRQDFERWLELSAHREIPTSLLLWIQSFYLSSQQA